MHRVRWEMKPEVWLEAPSLGCWLQVLRSLFLASEDCWVGKATVSKCCRRSPLVEKWETGAREATRRVPVADDRIKNQGRGSTEGGVAVRRR